MTELLHLLRQRRTLEVTVKNDRRSIFIVRFLSTSWKRIVKFLICICVVLYILLSVYYPVWLIFQSDINTKESLNRIPLCPCRVSTTWNDKQLGFDADSACDGRKSGYWNCRFHQGAKGCYRQKSTTSASGAQCCYDVNGEWISDWRKGAGTLDFYYPETWRNISTYQHFFSDVLSYFSCSIGAATIIDACEQYMKYRPAGKCENIPLTLVCKDGDLHLSTREGELLCQSH